MSETASAPPVETNYLRSLLHLGQILNVSLDLEQVLHIAITQVVQFVKAERGFILLVEEGTKRVWGKAAHGIDMLDLESVLSGRDTKNRPQVSRTILEEVLRDRRSVLSTNAMEDPRYQAHTSVQLSNVRSVLCVPLIAQGQTLGIVYLDNRMKVANFNEHDAEMLTAFANQAAVAIQNARLYDNLRKSMEDRLRLQQEVNEKETQRLALEEANRLKSDFIGYVSHELRNPLTTIRGYVQTLADDTEHTLDAETCKEFYETIEAEADRMLTLINELLDSSRLEAHRPLTLNAREIDIAPVLRKMARAQRFSKHWTPQHTIAINIAEDLPRIEADEDKILQIAANLLSNAVKYSPKGGEVSLEAHPAKDGVEIVVLDHGVGLNEEQKVKLFGRYERVERADIQQISGTGLGLFLTRHLVELHGGKIECESKPGKGSVFKVFLPLTQPDAATASVEP
jgi:signal transduction histidine kinase